MTFNNPSPWKIKAIEPIPNPSPQERIAALSDSGFNLFNISSSLVTIDLLTDSGTGSMSQNQWSAILSGDESYAGSQSFYSLKKSVEDLFGYSIVIPTHQGRAAEDILFSAFGKKNKSVISNHLFDTTTAHALEVGMKVFSCLEKNNKAFGGNFDLCLLEKYLKEEDVDLIVATVTCNSAGGLPVSLENLRQVKKIADSYSVKIWIDMARIAENSYFQYINGEGKNPKECAFETCSLSDGGWMSSKKDGLVNIGGFIALKDNEDKERYERLVELEILKEGFITYGGLAGRDMNALSVGLKEALDERYLKHRVNEIKFLYTELDKIGVPCVDPGGHAVYIDAGKWLPHLKSQDFPAQSLALALYLVAGIRTSEIGSLCAGRDNDGKQIACPGEYLRLAIPRRTYTSDHFIYIKRAFEVISQNKDSLPKLKFEKEAKKLRHFQSVFKDFLWTPSKYLNL